ncbi:MAG: GatB/YqeY domain-containing protein [Candidatus Omnitrophica bacterium]|nr:GatB/YqeY domain-containing protein [Candidatus Omnitrophota bacterium]MDD5351915.1 GatB/YqeY domain-containing protein [Candidatus Omnitrophota bacterium]MDD5550741.1 GatB/YqeY domain-containing protein [Candidatus Omnitrophota bacterium]
MLEDKILADFKEAMKSKNNLRSSTLSFLRSQLKNAAIEKRKDKLDDSEVIVVIKKQVKQRQDSIEQFKSGGRLDLANKEQGELEILKTYLPQELSKEEVEKIIEETIVQLCASGIKDMGKVMKEVTPKVAGRVDNKFLSDSVRARLTKNESSNPESK